MLYNTKKIKKIKRGRTSVINFNTKKENEIESFANEIESFIIKNDKGKLFFNNLSFIYFPMNWFEVMNVRNRKKAFEN